MEPLKSKMMVKRAMPQLGDNRPAKKMRVDEKKQPASDNGLGPVLSTIVQTAVKRARSRVNMAAKAARASSNNVAAKKTSPEVVKAAVDRAKSRVKMAAIAAKGAASDNMRNTSKKRMPEMAVGNDSTKKAPVDGEKQILHFNSGDLVVPGFDFKIVPMEDSFGSEEKSNLVNNPSPKNLTDMWLDTSGSEDSVSSGRSALSTTGDNMFMTDSDKKPNPQAPSPQAKATKFIENKPKKWVLADAKEILKSLAQKWVAQGIKIVDKLGKGAFGVVRKLEIPDSLDAAVKIASHEEVKKEFEALNRLARQPGIIQLRPTDASNRGLVFKDGAAEPVGYVMELGIGSVASMKEPLSQLEIHVLARHLIDGGASMEKAKLVHRDLKPQNLIVFKSPEGSKCFKIADFGLVVNAGESVGGFEGTAAYIPPEAIDAHSASSKQDVFSAGLIIAEQLIGLLKKPDFSHIISARFGLAGVQDKYKKAYYSPAVVLLTEVKDKYPESKDLVDLAIKMMDSDPAERPTFSECSQSVSAFQNPTVNAHEAV